MKLIDLTLSAYLDMLSSDEPAPGGGSASALMGAQGAGLASMVCALTVGKKKYLEHEELCRKVQQKTLALKNRMVELIDRDTQAFNEVTAVFSMPRETEEEKAARKEAMQAALKTCTVTPYEIMETALEALHEVDAIVGKSNQSAASDLGVAALNLKGSLQGAWLNVCINLAGITDQVFADDYRAKGEKLLAEGMPLADSIYERTVELM